MEQPLTPEPTFRALLVGVNHYPRNRTPAGTFQSLSGCVHDVESVEALLRARVTAPHTITKLLSPVQDGKPIPPPAGVLLPTYANLRAALEKLVEDTREGDSVLVYYSGHGARIPTAFPDLKGPLGKDEALVPMDIGDPQTPYVRDVDLAFVVHQLVRKKAVVTLVIDSCHSGGVTRAARETGTAIRCATGRPDLDATDDTERPRGRFASDEQLSTAYAALRESGKTRAARAGKSWLPRSSGYVLLAACLETQAAIEAGAFGLPCMGVLTRAWLDTLRDIGADQSWKTVGERTERRMRDAGFRQQIPVLLGDDRRQVFGPRLREADRGLTVSEIDPERSRVRVDGGLAMGLDVGSEIGIHDSSAAEGSPDDGLLAAARITEVSADSAWAAVGADVLPRIPEGAKVVLRSLAVRSKVALARRDSPPPGMTSAAERDALDAVRDALPVRGEGFVTEAARGETPAYQVGLDDQERYVLMSAERVPLPGVSGIPLRAENAARRVVDRLAHLARCAAIARISSPSSRLDSSVEVALFPAGADAPLSADERGRYRAPVGQYEIRIVNRSSSLLFCGVLVLQSDLAFRLIWPGEGEGRAHEVVPPGEQRVAPVELYLERDDLISEDRLKVFLLTTPADYRRLTLPSINSRGALGEPRSAMDRLFEAIARPKRECLSGRVGDAPWRVQDFVVEVHRS